jgi:ATP-dependent DNA ligase
MMTDSRFPILYKRTSTGDIQVWYGAVEGNSYTTSSGKLDGKITTKKPTVCEPKNVGKKNEISAEDQAVAELEALYKKKRRQDYRDKLEDVDSGTRFKPMLAAKWADVGEDVPENELIYLQPKFDGFRCISRQDGLETRDGLPIPTAPHIYDALQPLFTKYPGVVFDGELYNHELHDNFNEISSILRKKKPTEEDLIRSSRHVQFHVYDLPSHGELDYSARFTALQTFVAELDSTAQQMIRVANTTAGYSCDVPKYLDDRLAEGFEGAIVRLDRPYEHKRSKHLLKVKKFLDEEFIIVDVVEGEGNRAGTAAAVILRTDEMQEFKAGIIGNVEYARELLERKNDFIGQRGTVQFLRWTPAPRKVPYGGKFKEVRFG